MTVAEEKEFFGRVQAILTKMPYGGVGFKDVRVANITSADQLIKALESLRGFLVVCSERNLQLQEDHERLVALFRDLDKLLGEEGRKIVNRATKKK